MASVGPFAFGGSDYSGSFTEDGGSLTETGGKLDSDGASSINRAHVTTTMDTAAHWAQATIGGRNTSNHGAVYCRHATAGTDTMYECVMTEDSAADGHRIRYVSGGSEANVDTAASTTGAKVFKLIVADSSQEGWIDGSNDLSGTDANITSGALIGVRVWHNNGGRFDDFSGADTAAAGAGGSMMLMGVGT